MVLRLGKNKSIWFRQWCGKTSRPASANGDSYTEWKMYCQAGISPRNG